MPTEISTVSLDYTLLLQFFGKGHKIQSNILSVKRQDGFIKLANEAET